MKSQSRDSPDVLPLLIQGFTIPVGKDAPKPKRNQLRGISDDQLDGFPETVRSGIGPVDAIYNLFSNIGSGVKYLAQKAVEGIVYGAYKTVTNSKL